jgi:hypothetical protein
MFESSTQQIGNLITELFSTLEKGKIKRIEADCIDLHIIAYTLTPGQYRIDIKEIK